MEDDKRNEDVNSAKEGHPTDDALPGPGFNVEGEKAGEAGQDMQDAALPVEGDEAGEAGQDMQDAALPVEGDEAGEAGQDQEDAALPVEGDEAGQLSDDVTTFAKSRAPEDAFKVEETPNSSPEAASPSSGSDYLKQIDGKLEDIAENEQRLFSEVREIHKLYHTEFAGRLKSMQDELDQYRKIDKGRAFDDILGSIARIYCNYETLEDEVAEPKAKKSIRYMLMDIEDLLSDYGMEKQRSAPGEKRNPRHCQVLNRIPTGDPAGHDTVAKSYNSGFHIGNRTVIKEVVDIFIYEGKVSAAEIENEKNMETDDIPVSE